MKLTHEKLATLPLCKPELDRLRKCMPADEFDAADAIHAYVADGGNVPYVARAYQACVNAGLLPDTGLIWRIARIAFREQPESSGLRRWADALGPDNWREAADDAASTTYATTAACAAYAARAAADAAAASAYTTYDAAAASAAAAYASYAAADSAARYRVTTEILKMIIAEIKGTDQ